jgi:Mg2+ and Co2+ transporter CorA
MLRVYRREESRLVPTDLDLTPHSPPADATGALWLDLINPTRGEVHFAEHLLGISIPTREEAQEIEVSARLYHEDDAEFMTMTGVSQLESEAPMTTLRSGNFCATSLVPEISFSWREIRAPSLVETRSGSMKSAPYSMASS